MGLLKSGAIPGGAGFVIMQIRWAGGSGLDDGHRLWWFYSWKLILRSMIVSSYGDYG